MNTLWGMLLILFSIFLAIFWSLHLYECLIIESLDQSLIINNDNKRLHISCRGVWKYSMNLCFGIFSKVVNFCEFWISICKTNLTTTRLLLTSLQSVSTHFKAGAISFKMSMVLTLSNEQLEMRAFSKSVNCFLGHPVFSRFEKFFDWEVFGPFWLPVDGFWV